MKRQTQELGIRDWYGDSFVSLQAEPLKVIDSFFSQYGAFVLSGCEVAVNGSKFDIAPGLVVLEGAGAGNATVKVVVPFEGIKATPLPVYLTLGYETETDVYHDGNVKPIADIYKAVATTVKPAGSYVQIIRSGGVRFIDAIQDPTHRFITDTERQSWEGKVDKVPGKGLSTNDYTNEDKQHLQGTAYYDYVVDSDEKLAGLKNNPEATNVLIKKGEWTYKSPDRYGIRLHPNTKQISGEVGSTISVTNADYCLSYEVQPKVSVEYCVKNVTVKTSTNNSARLFYNMVNLTNCVGYRAITGSSSAAYIFSNCNNLYRCSGSSEKDTDSVFYYCENMIQCNDISPVNTFTISNCTNVFQCEGNRFQHSVFVSYCSGKNFSSCYSGNKELGPTYYADNTLNGGWNRTIS